jgi:Leucine-rich repeat (LRR) protein
MPIPKTKKEKYNNLTLSRTELKSIPQVNRSLYLRRVICKKYDTENISIACEICPLTVAYDDNGYITDEDLLSNER